MLMAMLILMAPNNWTLPSCVAMVSQISFSISEISIVTPQSPVNAEE